VRGVSFAFVFALSRDFVQTHAHSDARPTPFKARARSDEMKLLTSLANPRCGNQKEKRSGDGNNYLRGTSTLNAFLEEYRTFLQNQQGKMFKRGKT
jgi:hypothetical protein